MRANKAWSKLTPSKVISRKRWSAVCVVVLAMAATLVSQTQDSQRANRITQEVTSGAMVTIPGSVHPQTRQATDLGEVNSGMHLDSLSLNIGLSAAQQTELDALLAAQQDPKSPQYHQWLTPEAYGARFGLTQADLNEVTGWLVSQGFTVKSVAPSRNLITFSGTVPEVESAFRTQIHQYQLADGTTHFSNATQLSIPKALSGVVVSVRGLSSFRPKPHAIRRAQPDFTSSVSGEHFLTPGDWATIYDVNPIYTAGYTGTGMHVGVAGQTYIPPADIANFRAAAGLSATLPTMTCISSSLLCGATGAPSNESIADVSEADLDVEWSGGIAKNATVEFIYAAADDSQSVFDALIYGITTYTVNGAVVPVFSVSYGDCEYDARDDPDYKNYLDGYLAQAAVQGQTILIASGDDGAGCTISSANNIATNGASVSWPATSPNVTAVGGTTFSGDGSDTYGDQYWNSSTTADIINSAIKYIPETSWNDTAADGTLSASTGGVSILYPLPSWQAPPSNYTGASGRFVPDVSFSASPDHDGYLVCTENFPASETTGAPTSNPGSTCVVGFRMSASGDLTVYGGTSASAQVFGGMMTLLVQKYGLLGNINKTLYGLAANPTTYDEVFHDITTGDNFVPCDAGTTGCVSGEVGFSAMTGYDLVTGLGSIDGGALYNALAPASTSTATTATSVTASPTPLQSGASVTITATVSGLSASAAAPTGSVIFTVGSTTLGTVALTSGATGTAKLTSAAASWTGLVTTANGFATGSNTITASYGGSASFAASSGATVLTVTLPTGTAATSTAVTVSPTSVAQGASVAVTATVSGSGATPTGNVTFTVGSATLATVALNNGVANWTGAASLANGFTTGSNTIAASYAGSPSYSTSSGTASLTVTAATTPPGSYALTSSQTSLTGSSTVTLTLTSSNYAGTVTLTPTVTSSNGNAADVTAALSSTTVTLVDGGTGTSTLTITANSSAAKHSPGLPWRSGGAMAFAMLLGVPFTLRRKRALAVLLTALTISAAGFLIACGGGSSSSPKPSSARTYTVTVAAAGSGTVTNPSPVTITLTVQ